MESPSTSNLSVKRDSSASPVERKQSLSPSATVVGGGFTGLVTARLLQNENESIKGKEASREPVKIGDRSTSDVVVRIRTDEGRDDRFYCHSKILTEKSKYFADRLSENWPTCQILDSRYCVEVYCQELEFNFHVNALRLLYIPEPYTWHGVRNALGILQVAVHLGCPHMARACTDYLEAVPWEEAEEEEILRIIPGLGSQYAQILARLQPVDQTTVVGIFISTIRFATSSPPMSMRELKSSAQDQLEYMLTEDDNVPLLTLEDGVIKSEVKTCVNNLLSRFNCFVESIHTTTEETILKDERVQDLKYLLCDISWACQILSKLEMMKDLVQYWVEASEKIVRAVAQLRSDGEMLETKLKVVEVAWKVLEAIGFGNIIFPTARRLHVVKVWLPFVRRLWPLAKPGNQEDAEEVSSVKLDGDVWQGLESAFISIVLTLPLGDQANILAEWLGCQHVRYPDLTEAFEVWCYRSKIAKKRLALTGRINNAYSTPVVYSIGDNEVAC